MNRLATGRAALIVLAALGVIGFSVWRDRSSLERGNRYFRDGEFGIAERIYRGVAETSPGRAAARYNLGTTLLTRGSEEALEHLRAAAEGEDSAAAHAGHYNLGYLSLLQYESVASPDSAARLLELAVESNRAALLLDPEDENARWNLALAQRFLDAAIPQVARENPEEEETSTETPVGVPTAAPEQNDDTGPRGPEEEALAVGDPGPLTEEEALGLVEPVDIGSERAVQGILWARRPSVDWWTTSFPGGNW